MFLASCSKPQIPGKEGSFKQFLSSSPEAEELYNRIISGEISKDFFSKPADTSTHSQAYTAMYFAAISALSKNDDSVLAYSFKSIITLSRSEGGSILIFPDTLLNIMGRNYSKGMGFYYSMLASMTYDTLPDYSMSLCKKAAVCHAEMKNDPWVAFAYLNMSTLYEENKDYDSAIYMADSAIEIWKTVGDTSQLANLYKLKGLLLGKKRNFKDGKAFINEAYNIYSRLKYEPGKFVSLHDLGELYCIEENYDSAMFCFYSEREFWKQVNDTQRFFIATTSLSKAHDKLGDSRKVFELINENERILSSPTIVNVNRNEFIMLKADLAKKYNRSSNAVTYVLRKDPLNEILSLIHYKKAENLTFLLLI